MKTNIINTLLLGSLLVSGAALTSCTDKFDEWNHNPNEVTEEEMKRDNLNTGAYFAQMQRGVFIVGNNLGGEWQITEGLEGDLFAGYLATITTWGYATWHNDHYRLYDGWYNAPFNDAYTNIMTPWQSIVNVTDENSPARAMATVIKVLAMQRITDMYGPIPYSKFGTAVQVAYDSQKDVYDQMFTELANAITVLSDYAANNSTYLADYDNVYSGNVSKWIKMANTLRLRMAMRVSNVEESKAREEAQAAISNSYGLMQTSDDDAILHQSSSLTFYNPLWEVCQSFQDEAMSATIASYLKGYNDPRLESYFTKASSTGEYTGVRNGTERPNKDSYKDVVSVPNFSRTSNMPWMHAAEAWFLMAEAKLRFGLGSETAQQYYEQGIRVSFASAGVSGADTYIANSESLPLDTYTDPVNGRSTSVSSMLTMLPVAWDADADDDTNLQRIMVQKYLALYPDGEEAWAEMRRTGYPGFVQIASYSHQSEVTSGELISRLKFPTTEYTNNGENTRAAVQLLGGNDAAGTRLWWDVKR